MGSRCTATRKSNALKVHYRSLRETTTTRDIDRREEERAREVDQSKEEDSIGHRRAVRTLLLLLVDPYRGNLPPETWNIDG